MPEKSSRKLREINKTFNSKPGINVKGSIKPIKGTMNGERAPNGRAVLLFMFIATFYGFLFFIFCTSWETVAISLYILSPVIIRPREEPS